MKGSEQEYGSDKTLISIISHSSAKYGAERAMLELIDILLERGIHVHVVLPEDGPLEKDLNDRKIVYDKVKLKWWVNCSEKKNEALEEINDNAMELAAVLMDVCPDLIYTTTSVVPEGAIVAKFLGIPHVWNVSEFGREEHGIKYLLDEKEKINFINNNSDKISFASLALRDYYAKFIVIENKSFILPPITNDGFKDYKENPSVSFFHKKGLKIAIIGNIIQGKGQKDAINALKDLKGEYDDIELVIAGGVGDENYYNELKNFVEKNRLNDRISFVGYIDNAIDLIKQSDLVLSCSVFEGFGRVIIESFLNKKPVIGAMSGATIELIEDGKTGFLYEADNYKSLADKIKYFINNRDKIVDFGQRGFKFVEKEFSKEVISKRIVDEMLSLKKKKGKEISHEAVSNLLRDVVRKGKTIREMRASKFWKLRRMYMKMKHIITKHV